MLDTLLEYIPVIAFLTAMWIYHRKATKYEFDMAAAFAVLGVSLKLGMQYFLDYENLIPNLVLIGVGVALFLFLVYSAGNKASGETLLALSVALALAPWFSGVLVYGAGILLLVIRLSLSTMKTMGMDAKTLAGDVAYQTGILDGAIPSLNNMDANATGQRTSVVPPMLLAFAVGAVVAALITLM